MLSGCSKRRSVRFDPEPIRRHEQDSYEMVVSDATIPSPTYPWDHRLVGQHPRITQEFFRCRGVSVNPLRTVLRGSTTEVLLDCEGGHRHSLPVRHGKEEIYFILPEILNYLQERSGHRVVITCGHRCPKHNSYADPSSFNATSKHQIGAEVDFYLEGMEHEPMQVVEWIQEFYSKQPEYGSFQRYEKTDTNVSTPPWFNKEILIKLFKDYEGRDLDNQHPYPYLCIQVRYDRKRNSRITYSWDEAFYGYWRGS